MTAAILAILAAIIPFGIWLLKRKAARDDSPEAKRDEIHEAIAKGDANDVSRLLDDTLRMPAPKGKSNSSGPGSDKT